MLRGSSRRMVSHRINQRIEKSKKGWGCIFLSQNKIADMMAKTLIIMKRNLISGRPKKWPRNPSSTCFLLYPNWIVIPPMCKLCTSVRCGGKNKGKKWTIPPTPRKGKADPKTKKRLSRSLRDSRIHMLGPNRWLEQTGLILNGRSCNYHSDDLLLLRV